MGNCQAGEKPAAPVARRERVVEQQVAGKAAAAAPAPAAPAQGPPVEPVKRFLTWAELHPVAESPLRSKRGVSGLRIWVERGKEGNGMPPPQEKKKKTHPVPWRERVRKSAAKKAVKYAAAADANIAAANTIQAYAAAALSARLVNKLGKLKALTVDVSDDTADTLCTATSRTTRDMMFTPMKADMLLTPTTSRTRVNSASSIPSIPAALVSRA